MKGSRVQSARARPPTRSRDVVSQFFLGQSAVLSNRSWTPSARKKKKGRWEEARVEAAATRSKETRRNQRCRVTSSCCRSPDRKGASGEHVSLVKCEQRESSHDMSVSFVRRGPTSGSGPFVQQIKRLTSRGLSLHLSLFFLLVLLPSRSLCLSSQLVCPYHKLPPTQWWVPLSLPFYLCSFSVSVCFFCLRLMKICLVETSSHTWNSRYVEYFNGL